MFYTLQVLVIMALDTATSLPETILLNDGNRIPALSFGTFGKVEIVDLVVKPAVIKAIESGYRQIDTAALYQNEKQVGEAIADVINRGIVTREELWITTKLHPSIGTREEVFPALKESLKKLELDYVDLFVIHSAGNEFVVQNYDILEIWKGMEDVKKLNMTRSIGTSNFNSFHLNKILANCDTVPAANEIEVNPTYTELELVAYCQSKNIVVLSYAPFGFKVPRPWIVDQPVSTFEEPILKQLALKYKKAHSQIVIRYLIDRGMIPIVKSINATRIRMNAEVFDFQLTPREIYKINELNQGMKVYSEESLVDFITYYGLS